MNLATPIHNDDRSACLTRPDRTPEPLIETGTAPERPADDGGSR
jgi:hypothetical protein